MTCNRTGDDAASNSCVCPGHAASNKATTFTIKEIAASAVNAMGSSHPTRPKK
jgi:hypothetical protein